MAPPSKDRARDSPGASERPVVVVVGSRDAARALGEVGFDAVYLRRPEDAYATATSHRERAIVVVERALRQGDTQQRIAELRKRRPLTDVLLWAPGGGGPEVVAAMRGGARDAVLEADPMVLARRVREVVDGQILLPQVQSVRNARQRGSSFEGMVSRAQVMWDLFEAAARVAATEASVLILGETGTGKELLARAIHRRSGRSGRFVAVNCSSLPEGLVDAELFGHERGTFTGALRARPGLFRHAEGGTLFLDEIGNVPLAAQFSLLRVLQEERIRPVGGHEEVPVDVRVIAATSAPLEDAVARGTFREDLLYRLDVIRLVMPSLRDRPGDLAFLFNHFARRLAKEYTLPRPRVTESFLSALLSHPWPGNVRQLENFTERLVLTHPNETLSGAHFQELTRPYTLRGRAAAAGPRDLPAAPPAAAPPAPPPPMAIDPERTLAENLAPVVEAVERAYLEALLRRFRGRVGLVAQQADVHRRTVLRKLRALGLSKQAFRGGAAAPEGPDDA